MNRYIFNFRKVITGIFLGALACSPVRADDIEIYVGVHNGVETKPNVLFILDNSGSMHFNYLTGPDPYDHTNTYSGSFASGFYYWTADGSLPTDPATDNKIATANFHCNTGVTPLSDHGIYTDKALAWRVAATASENAWSDIESYSYGIEDIECSNDEGVHGNGGADLYPSDGATGPWSSAGNAIDWNDATFYYTFYTSNYLNYEENPPTSTQERYDIMVTVVDRLLRQISNVNVGLMWFRSQGGEGGFIDNAVVDIDTLANREQLLTTVNIPQTHTVTPLSETMYEAYRYFSGDTVFFGERANPVGDSHSNESVDAARVSPALTHYKTPIEFECQKNYILLLTDGEPYSDTSVNSTIPSMPDFVTRTGSASCDTNGFGNNGRCLDEVADYMNYDDNNLAPAVEGPHSIQTYTIGFQINNSLLKDTAEGPDDADDTDGGGGTYHFANDTSQLADAFAAILGDISGAPSTFTAPAVSVNAFNRTLNREFLYYTMFLPDERPRWDGNLKKYRLIFNTDGTAYISDNSSTAPPPDVVDPNTGDFIDTAKSYWGSITDGNDVNKGGVRARLSDAALNSRNVWTDTGTNSNLSDSSNAVSASNSAITPAMLGIASTPLKNEIAEWMRGVDLLDEDGDLSTTDSRRTVGDPLHSQPQVVTYGGTENAPEQVIFFTTNDGYLHAVDESTGDELFAYIPNEMLPVQATLYKNTPSTVRPYGLDSSVSTWTNDVNGDGTIDPAEDHVYIYFGMRRGGDNYYALDVTNIKENTPSASLLWKIVNGNLVAGAKGTDTAGAYSMLGQTWSQPLVRKVKIGSEEKMILAIGGGYDTNQDLVTVRTTDTVGKAVYFINAVTGAREWWASTSGANLNLPQMLYSIPSRLAGYDITGDGLMDRMYFGDMGGQIWRLDIENGNSASALVTGGAIASLAGATEEEARRFYTPPDAALLVEAGGAYLSLAIGSGYRAHPLDEKIEDRLYMIKDTDIYTAPATYTTLTESDLYDATDNDIGEETGSSQETAITANADADGWYIELGEGEKSLSAPLILGGVAIMTTFTPTSVNACNPDGGGNGKVYYLNLGNATPVYNFDGVGTDTELTADDRGSDLQSTGIPPETAYIVGTDSDGNIATAVLHGREEGFDPGQNLPIKTYWYEP